MVRPIALTRDVQLALAVWTAEVGRARREYYADPTDEQLALARAKAVRRAEVMRKNRERKKKQ